MAPKTSYEIQMIPPADGERWWRYTVTIGAAGDTWTSSISAPLLSEDRDGAYAEALAAVRTLVRTLAEEDS
jgi:hypothetical protein